MNKKDHCFENVIHQFIYSGLIDLRIQALWSCKIKFFDELDLIIMFSLGLNIQSFIFIDNIQCSKYVSFILSLHHRLFICWPGIILNPLASLGQFASLNLSSSELYRFPVPWRGIPLIGRCSFPLFRSFLLIILVFGQ